MGFAPLDLPYPWDTISRYTECARQHPGGMIDLSIGTPVDPTPQIVRRALSQASESHGYPTTAGTPALREAIAGWFSRRRAVPGLDPGMVLPTIGSKELVGLLPSLLGLGPGDVVVHPEVAYPTYDVGARVAGARPRPAAGVEDWAGDKRVRLVWVNSPSNPTGRVAPVEELAAVVRAAREIGAVVASDECYAELDWSGEGVPSLLDPRVSQGSLDGLLTCYSLSKQSNMAGYRAAFVAGDRRLIDRLLATRKHLGMIVPGPVQAAMVAALHDDEHVAEQAARYARRREVLSAALGDAGFAVDHSEAGIYLWTRVADPGSLPVIGQEKVIETSDDDLDCWDMMSVFAKLGILVGPGEFYGPAGVGHVRVALTSQDDAIDEAAGRLRELSGR